MRKRRRNLSLLMCVIGVVIFVSAPDVALGACETPESLKVLSWHPFWGANLYDDTYMRDAMVSEGYVGLWVADRTVLDDKPGNSIVPLFRTLIRMGHSFYIITHGNVDADTGQYKLTIESYLTMERTDKAFQKYEKQPAYRGKLLRSFYFMGTYPLYGIAVKESAVAAWGSGKHGARKQIAYVTACDSFHLFDDLRGGLELGYASTADIPPIVRDVHLLMGRMSGLLGQGKLRPSGDAIAAGGYYQNFRHSGDIETRTVLAPTVLAQDPIVVHCTTPGVPQSGQVLFDCTMKTAPELQPIQATGCITILSMTWMGNDALQFRYLASPGGGGTTFTVLASQALSANNEVKLDGNSNPAGVNGVAPNGDDFTWSATCQPCGGTACPTAFWGCPPVIAATINGLAGEWDAACGCGHFNRPIELTRDTAIYGNPRGFEVDCNGDGEIDRWPPVLMRCSGTEWEFEIHRPAGLPGPGDLVIVALWKAPNTTNCPPKEGWVWAGGECGGVAPTLTLNWPEPPPAP